MKNYQNNHPASTPDANAANRESRPHTAGQNSPHLDDKDRRAEFQDAMTKAGGCSESQLCAVRVGDVELVSYSKMGRQQVDCLAQLGKAAQDLAKGRLAIIPGFGSASEPFLELLGPGGDAPFGEGGVYRLSFSEGAFELRVRACQQNKTQLLESRVVVNGGRISTPIPFFADWVQMLVTLVTGAYDPLELATIWLNSFIINVSPDELLTAYNEGRCVCQVESQKKVTSGLFLVSKSVLLCITDGECAKVPGCRVALRLPQPYLKDNFGIRTPADFFNKAEALLRVLTHEWCRFTTQADPKSPVTPLWDTVQGNFLAWAQGYGKPTPEDCVHPGNRAP